MKRFLTMLLLFTLLTGCLAAAADTISIDLDTATLSQLQAVQSAIADKLTQARKDLWAAVPTPDAVVDTLDFDLIRGNEEKFRGRSVQLIGTVTQITKDSEVWRLRMAVDNNEENLLYITYTAKAGEVAPVKGDTLYIQGTLTGAYTYTASATSKVTLPACKATVLTFATDALNHQVESALAYTVTHYLWSTKNTHYIALIIGNCAFDSASYFVNLVLRDEKGNIVGAKLGETACVPSGESAMLLFNNTEGFAYFTHDITVTKRQTDESILPDLNTTLYTTPGKAILSVENVGEAPLQYLKSIVLFLREGEVVDQQSRYIMDKENELKPGKALVIELPTAQIFDSVLTFLEGKK